MNAAVYARVSTDLQAEKGYSLQTQIDACTQKAKEMGAVAIKTYVDDGYSGSYLERPALDKLRDALDAKLYDMVVIYDQDRLSRTLSHQLLLTEEIEKSGAQLVFVSSEYKRTPEGILFYQIKGAFSAYEKEKIRERMMRRFLRVWRVTTFARLMRCSSRMPMTIIAVRCRPFCSRCPWERYALRPICLRARTIIVEGSCRP